MGEKKHVLEVRMLAMRRKDVPSGMTDAQWMDLTAALHRVSTLIT
jgi:hypothetical protein